MVDRIVCRSILYLYLEVQIGMDIRKQGTAITRTSVSGLQIMLLLVLAAYAACNSIQVSASSWSQASSSTI